MAKEQVHNWLRTVVVILTIGVAGGGYAMKINSNTTGIEKVGIKVEKVDDKIDRAKEEIHKIAIHQGKIEGVAIRSAEALSSIDARLDGIQKAQTAQATSINAKLAKYSTVQAVNSEKLSTLTKD